MLKGIENAAVVLPCRDLSTTVDWFQNRLGFALESIRPASDPRTAVLRGHGLRLRLDRDCTGDPGMILIEVSGANPLLDEVEGLRAPNGTRICCRRVDAPGDGALGLRGPGVVLAQNGGWTEGRAGMRYRQLTPPAAQPGFGACQIAIPKGGAVPDYVHYHRVRFQIIYCLSGRVRVVYEDQGSPLWLDPGDCLLQPPGIRHRVLECTDGLEVLEFASPADHETYADPDTELPSAGTCEGRLFDGQRFHLHRGGQGEWRPGWLSGTQVRAAGMASASGGLLEVGTLRPAESRSGDPVPVPGDFAFLYLLRGQAVLEADGARWVFAPGDAVTLPGGARVRLTLAPQAEALEVSSPAAPGPGPGRHR